MSTDYAKTALELLKLSPRYLVAPSLVAGAMVFSPNPWLQRLGLDAFVASNRGWIGLAFLVLASLMLVSIVAVITRLLRRPFEARERSRRIAAKLASLTEPEKQILRYYVAEGTRTNQLRIGDGVVAGLATSGIIYRATGVGDLVEGFAFNIHEEAWNQLNANVNLLIGTTNLYRTDRNESYRRGF